MKASYFWNTDRADFIAQYLLTRLGRPDNETEGRYDWKNTKAKKQCIQELADRYGKTYLAVEQVIKWMLTKQHEFPRTQMRMAIQLQIAAKEVGLISKSVIDKMSSKVVK